MDRLLPFVVLLACTAGAAVQAQEGGGPDTTAAPESTRVRQAPVQPQTPAAGPSFLVARYASVHALAMYSGYRVNRVLLVVGMLHNPRSSYREVMGGVGLPLPLGGGSDLTVVAAGASTNSGWYGQLYLLPTIVTGPLVTHATVQYAQPLSDRGVRAVYVSPGNALYYVGRGLRLGAGYYSSMEDGYAAYHGLGPAIQRAVPNGTVTVEWIAALTAGRDEWRVTLRSSF